MALTHKKSESKVGCAYSKTTKNGGNYLSVLINADQLAAIEPDEKGNIRLSLFPNTYKEKDSQPDYNLVKPTARAAGVSGSNGGCSARQTQGVGNARTKGSNFPF